MENTHTTTTATENRFVRSVASALLLREFHRFDRSFVHDYWAASVVHVSSKGLNSPALHTNAGDQLRGADEPR